MSYNANVPLATQSISSTQAPIQTNFSIINSSTQGFAVDHQTLTDATDGGKHNKVSLLQQGADPAALATTPIIYSKQVNYPGPVTRSELFLREALGDGGSVVQMTNLFTTPSAGANGTTTLPGGIILKWGTVASVVNNTTITFATAFPNNCYNVSVTVIRNDTASRVLYVRTGSVTTTQFIVRTDSGGTSGIYYMAIGN
jgi:hypothetical protein